MAFMCEVCLKKPVSGNNVSHANNKTRRVFNPNIQTVRAVVGKSHKRIRVCTRCLRSGLVKKARRLSAERVRTFGLALSAV